MKKSTLLFLAVVIVFVALLSPRLYSVWKLDRRSTDLNTEIIRLKKENALLERELRLLREDPVYLEKVAREKFNKAKQGEIVYKVVREGERTKENPQ